MSAKAVRRVVATASLLLACSRIWAEDAAAPAVPAAPAAPAITLINIHSKQALAEDVFTDMGKQAGIRFTTNGNMWESESMQNGMDIDITAKPFWSAVREVCGLWNVSPQQNYGNNSGRRIMLQQAMSDRSWDSLPSCEVQGFFVQAQSFQRNQSINYGPANPVAQNSCNLQLMVYIDPALRIQSFNQTAKVDEAVDDAGHSMVPDADNNRSYGGGQQRSLIYNCNVQLKYPDNAGKKISHLKCTLSLRASTKSDTLAVDKPMEAAETEKSFGDTTIIFESMKKNANIYEVKMAVSREDDGNGNSDIWSLLQNAQLLDAKNRPLQYAGGGGGGGNNGRSEYTINYSTNGGENHGEPVKWVIELPLEPKVMKIPVEFKDLPLP